MFSLWLLLMGGVVSCTNPPNTPETTRNDGDNTPIPPEAQWAQGIASLRSDDGGTNNGRARSEILEVLYALRERLGTEGLTSDVAEDLFIIRTALERFYSSANVGARSEWQFVSEEFTALENQLGNPEEARQTLNRIIARLGG